MTEEKASSGAPGEPRGNVEPPASVDRLLLRAAFYGLFLRARGYTPDEAATLVIARYPRAEKYLGQKSTG